MFSCLGRKKRKGYKMLYYFVTGHANFSHLQTMNSVIHLYGLCNFFFCVDIFNNLFFKK